MGSLSTRHYEEPGANSAEGMIIVNRFFFLFFLFNLFICLDVGYVRTPYAGRIAGYYTS